MSEPEPDGPPLPPVFFDAWLDAKGLSRTDAAEAMDTSTSKLSKLANGHQKWDMKWLSRAAEAIGIEPADLFRQPPDSQRRSNNEPLPAFITMRRATQTEPGSPRPFIPDQPAPPGHSGMIPEIDAEAGAGDGTVGDIVTVKSGGIISGHAIVQEWLVPRGHLGMPASRVVAMPVVGTSMIPAVSPGDVVFIDLRSQGIKNGEVYVIDEGDGPMVKRIRLNRDSDPISMDIISENQSVGTVTRPAELVRVIGRVIGRYQKF